jgi:hypothetical protein
MALFDRFRAQPKWKHTDPAVRLAAIDELPIEEQGLLATLAQKDADAHVRRAAVRKVFDPALLRQVAERDQDQAVRDDAHQVLVDLAVGAFDDSSESESLKALAHLTDAKHVIAVAKTASAEAVSLAALARVSDVKALGSVARRAEHASTRLAALARVDDQEERLAIALKSEHKDVATAALERLTDAERVRAVAARAALKAVVRRAKAMLRELEPAARPSVVAGAEAPASVPAPGANVERDEMCRCVEQAATIADRHAIESRLAAAEAGWPRLAGEADERRAARFAAACGQARAAVARLKADEQQRAVRAEQVGREEAQRVVVCEAAEALVASVSGIAVAEPDAAAMAARLDGVLASLRGVQQQWEAQSTPSLTPEDLERLDRRFHRALNGCHREIERARSLAGRRARMNELVEQAEAMAAAPLVGESRARWAMLRQEWGDLSTGGVRDEALAGRFEAAQTAFAARDAQAREEVQRRQREDLQRLRDLADRVEALANSETLTLKDGDRALKEIKSAIDRLTSGPSRKDRADLVERLRGIQAALFPKVAEMRESDEWLRWANVGVQEDLCRKAEALAGVADAADAARQVRDLQEQWKRASAVPRDKAQGLWERFKKASDEVHARAEAHLAEQATERAANLQRKEALSQQAEALVDSTDWIKTAEAIKQLQEQWKTIGAVPRGHEKAVWERFRAACDRFFTRRRDDLLQRKEQWAGNLAQKEALIARVDALAESGDWDRAVEEVKRIQAEWKTVGPVKKTRSEEVWQRFRGACDHFFERYQQRDQIQIAANIAARETLCAELEAFLPAADAVPGEAPEGLGERIADIRSRWQKAASLMPREALAALVERYNRALAGAVTAFPAPFCGTDLDLDAVRRRAEELCERVEKLVPAEAEAPPVEASPTAILAARLREALAANTIGGAVAVDQDARWKAAAAAVKDAQAAWAALGVLPADIEETLGSRFQRACREFYDARDRKKRP